MVGISNTQSLRTSLNVDPYYDDFKEDKNFYRLLFRPGLAVQARELTQMQTLLQNQIDRFAEHVFKEGSVVRGVEVVYDERVPFIRIRDNNATGGVANLSLLLNTEVTGNTSGVKALVLDTKFGSEANTPGTKTLYLQYTDGGNTTTQTAFTAGEILTSNTGQTARVLASAADGFGSRVTFGQGVIFAKDHFIAVPATSIVVGEYDSNTANYRVGFKLTESITTSNTDSTLLDPAQGAYNYTAPGANRLTITPSLVKYLDSETASDFVELVRFKNGYMTMLGNEPRYNELGDAMAERTHEESGNYNITGNKITLKEHLREGNNQGFLTSSAGGNTQQVAIEKTSGISYVAGFRNEDIVKKHLALDKAITHKQREDVLVSANYGNFVNVRELSGPWDVSGHDRVELYDKVQHSVSNTSLGTTGKEGSKIGEARIRGLEHSSGTKGTQNAIYKMYLYDIKMTANTFNNVKSFYYDPPTGAGAVAKADAVQVNANTVLTDSGFNRGVFELPSMFIKTVRDSSGAVDTEFDFYKTFTATIGTDGTFSVSSDTDETFILGTGAASTTQKQQNFHVVLDAGANTGGLTGQVSVTGTSNTLNGTGTSFDTMFAIGDKIRPFGQSEIFTVNEITNSTTIKTLETSSGTISARGYEKVFPAGTVINLSGKGANNGSSAGADRTATVASSTSVNFALKEELRASVNARITTKLRKQNGKEKSKLLRTKRLVKIFVGNNALANTASGSNNFEGPYNLGFSDVFNINFIRKSSTAFTSATQGTDVTSDFLLDFGQRDNFYDHGKIKKAPDSALQIANTDHLLVSVDYFAHDSSQGTGYFTVDSYPIDDANTSSNVAIATAEIPVYTSPVTGREYDLRGHIDVRPRIQDSATDTTALASATTNPSTRTTIVETSGGLHYPVPASNFDVDCQIYLGRRDIVLLDGNGDLRVDKGVPRERPFFPNTFNPDMMVLAYITQKPYPSLPFQSALRFRRPDLASEIREVATRRYTMADIGVLDDRIRTLEYYTSLSLLESKARQFDVKDDTGFARFKNGFLVDNFQTHNVGEVRNADYNIGIDQNRHELSPKVAMKNMELNWAFANSSGVTARSKNIVVGIAGSVDDYIEGETVSIGSASGVIHKITGTSNTISGDNFNSQKLYIKDWNGTVTIANNVTITGGTSGVSRRTVVRYGSTSLWGGLNYYRHRGPWLYSRQQAETHGVPHNQQGGNFPGLGLRPIGHLLTLPYSDELLISQPYASQGRNAQGLSHNYVGTMTLNPDRLIWADQNLGPEVTIDLDNGAIEAIRHIDSELRRLFPNARSGYSNVTDVEVLSSSRTRNGRIIHDVITSQIDTTVTDFNFGETQESTFDMVQDVSIQPFIKAARIDVAVHGLKPRTRHFAFFDGTDVSEYISKIDPDTLHANGGFCFANVTSRGSPHSMVTSANGDMNFSFHLPANDELRFRTGSRIPLRITDSSINSNELGIVNSSAEATLQASGLTVTKSATTLSTRSIGVTQQSTRRIETRRRTWADPLAQSFFIEKDIIGNDLIAEEISSPGIFLTKVELFFETKSRVHTVDIDIRVMDPSTNQPTQDVVPHSTVTLDPYEINTSSDGSIPTPVFFDTPIFLKTNYSYCLVVNPEPRNLDCKVWTARLGELDIRSQSRITTQPHNGILFVSANELTWRQQQEEDLKMNLYAADFGTNQTGTAVLKNKDVEYFKVSNTTSRFVNLQDACYGETVVTYGTLANTKLLVDPARNFFANVEVDSNRSIGNWRYNPLTNLADVTDSLTIRETGKVRSVNTSAKTISIQLDTIDVVPPRPPFARMGSGKFLRFRTGNSLTGTIIGNTSTVNTSSFTTPIGTVYNLDEFTSANSRILVLNNSTGNFRANTFFITTNGAIKGHIDEIQVVPSDIQFLQSTQMDLPGCSISATGKMGTTETTLDSTFSDYEVNQLTRLGDRKFVFSRSREVSNLSSQKSVEIRYNMSNSSDKRMSPAIDLQLGNFCAMENIINNDSTGETLIQGGGADARYITKTVELNEGQDAEDIRVIFDAYKPETANINVYYKILHADDEDSLALDVSYVQMTQNTISTVYSSSENTDDFKEYQYTPASSVMTGINNSIQYTNSNGVTFTGFKKFKIKIVLLTTDPSNPPRIRDLRALALQR